MPRMIAALALGLCLAGCTQWRYNMGSPLGKLEMPRPEERPTLGQILAEFGPPQRISAADSGYLLGWEHWHVTENSVGISLGILGVDFMSADWGRMRSKGEFLLLTFDREHRLSGATRSDWDSDGGGGQSIQPLFSFVSVVDADDLTGGMHQHRWGATRLERPARALNELGGPDSGRGGLEQRGTPTGTGQRSLEMR